MRKILFAEQTVECNFITAANRNQFVADFDCVVFDIVDFVDGHNVRFMYPDKFLRIKQILNGYRAISV